MKIFKQSNAVKKHAPQRTCVACHKIRPKPEMIHIVRLADGTVEIDLSRKRAGRGAYLCPSQDCWEKGFKGNRLEQALKTLINDENREQLARSSLNLLE